MNILQIIIIVLILIVIVGGVVAFSLNHEAERKRRMMSVIRGQAGTVKTKISEADEQNKRRAEIARKLKEAKGGSGGKKKKAKLPILIAQAGLDISVKRYWVFSVISMSIFILFAKWMEVSPFVMLMAAIIGLLGFPKLVLKKKAARRQKKFLEEFPDALEATVRLLKAGMPISEAIKMISTEYTGPVGDEMSIIYDKQRIGVSLAEAALESTKRMPLPEMQMFATGLAIQAQTGSSLSEVLMNLSGVIRARFRLKRKVKALSSEAIASASIIAALPNLVAAGLYFSNREYIMVLFTDPFGKVLLAGAIIWMGIGVMMMKIMINFKI